MQSELGRSWREFIREFRMNRVTEKLCKYRLSITETAFEVGFSSRSAFQGVRGLCGQIAISLRAAIAARRSRKVVPSGLNTSSDFEGSLTMSVGIVVCFVCLESAGGNVLVVSEVLEIDRRLRDDAFRPQAIKNVDERKLGILRLSEATTGWNGSAMPVSA